MKKNIYFNRFLRYYSAVVLLCLYACNAPVTPKPRGYLRIDFPDKEYKRFTSNCNFSFEAPVYSEVDLVKLSHVEPCWYDIKFREYGATIHLTYKPLHKDKLGTYSEDIRKIVYKHIVKADDIIELPINKPEIDVYGFLYDIKGNAASSVNFYITDSTTGFINGSLYFNVQPNIDSLAPAIDFFRQDIVHLINTFEWE
ncbi:hypothetical protein ES708_15728 [subsurface metagenome]